MELQGSQQADRFQHLGDVHLQTALQLDEEPADLRVDLPVFGPGDVTGLGLVGEGRGGSPRILHSHLISKQHTQRQKTERRAMLAHLQVI